MSATADPAVRDNVVAVTHGTPEPIPAGAERDAVDAIRLLAADAVERAGSGHPGTAMALAPVAYELYARQMRHDPAAPDWADRDRFVLSAGHASMLQYAALHLSGYDVGLEDLRGFRRLGSRTPGHPERGHTEGIEVGTGPLGQGLSLGVGLALAERMLAVRFNRPGHTVVDHRTWVIAGDGDIMEGVTSEATSLAGTLGLYRLTVLYDDNRISIEGDTERASARGAWQDVFARYRREHPELAVELERRMAGRLPEGWADELLAAVASEVPVATWTSLGEALNAAAARLPELVGGSATSRPRR